MSATPSGRPGLRSGRTAALRRRWRVAALDRQAGYQGRAGRGRAPALRLPDQDENAEVKPVHPKAMPVILRTEEEIDRWLTAPTEDALELLCPLPDGALRIVATGVKKDGHAAAMVE
jgi:hypothetical protein